MGTDSTSPTRRGADMAKLANLPKRQNGGGNLKGHRRRHASRGSTPQGTTLESYSFFPAFFFRF